MRLDFEVEYKGIVYKQPNCRLKIDCNGFVATLILNEKVKWQLVKGLVKNLNNWNTE